MIKIKISENESGQRIDRFLIKYMDKAPKGFIQKMIRKKRIKLNSKRAYPDDIININDELKLYMSMETINKFRSDYEEIKSNIKLNVIYEDDNIILIYKKKGDISHSHLDDKESISNALIKYLIDKKEYNPELEKTFTPAISNRLDRNTSGIIIGTKNYNALKNINKAIRNRNIDKYYKALVYGKVEKEMLLENYIIKNSRNNMVEITDKNASNAKRIETRIKPLVFNDEYTLLEVELITGRTHQIRAHLNFINHPIVGDKKYTNKNINKNIKLNSQFLVSYKIKFNNLDSGLEYLNGKSFEIPLEYKYDEILKNIF
ncbi:RluA family pseudouridine synthase [Senegalia massiliensis]|uniref:Pseudouridine synthase n=1 Tax=Senegalia massiliensis TaxID=1720316 RepID=A0A845QSZ0_9CLOT|nr:RluA family pseudouridine synthase [Senegalia massiliensis]NBI05321.1 RluA family pseudouridine synthase [Senegalia massiliensis]